MQSDSIQTNLRVTIPATTRILGYSHSLRTSHLIVADCQGEISGEPRGMLTTGPVIQRVAQLHTDDQARMNSMSHTGSDGSNLQTRADRVSLPWGAVGENVAVGFSSAKAVVMAWMCSPPHRKNLMSCGFSQIGVGTSVSQNGRKFYTQVFMCDISESCACDAGARKSPWFFASGHVFFFW